MPLIRPFRALRFDPTAVGDVAAVVAPPHEAVHTALRERLLARNAYNVVRVDVPEAPSREEPDDRYRKAARALAEWRSGAILHKDPHPSIYLHERVLGGVTQRGAFARLRLEPLEPGTGVRRHADAPPTTGDDRYLLLRATGVNTSPVVGVFDDVGGRSARAFESLTSRAPDLSLTDDAGATHRLWAVPADGDGEPAATAAAFLDVAAAGPIEVVAGQGSYDAALRYRDERRMSRSCEEDPAFDYVLTLFVARTPALPHPEALTGLVINPHEW